jgi:hypothetical protein
MIADHAPSGTNPPTREPGMPGWPLAGRGKELTHLTAAAARRRGLLTSAPAGTGNTALAMASLQLAEQRATAMVNRPTEHEMLRGLLSKAADGFGGAVVLRGEAGAGKTTLLDETLAVAAAAGMQTFRLTGVEPELQLGYAALHRLLLPFADRIERLPVPQRDALRSTFGLVAAPPADRFLVALAVLALLAEAAPQVPLVGAVDDAQWLDRESAVVLGVVARRLHAERMVLLFAVREPNGPVAALEGLPQLAVGGLDDSAAMELLAPLTPGPLSPAVTARLVAGTAGNPLALVEVARELSPAQLAGAQTLPEPLPVGGSLAQAFGGRLSQLAPETRLLLGWPQPRQPAPKPWCGARPGS